MPFDSLPDEVIPNPVRDRIDRAIEAIEQRGWCQGHQGVPSPSDYDGIEPVCLLGALGVVGSEYYRWNDDPSIRAVVKTIFCSITYGLVCCSTEVVFRWNDRIGRTKEEVISLLKQARERC